MCILFKNQWIYVIFSGICAKDDECKNQNIPTIGSKPNLEKFFFDLENVYNYWFFYDLKLTFHLERNQANPEEVLTDSDSLAKILNLILNRL